MTDKNYDELWCEIIIDRLIKNGVDHFFIAPGSRSTALVLALTNNPKAELHLGIDERSLGFMALGYGKKHQKPGVVVTTSGTAVANLYPCVVEAYMAMVPLILLTADRPATERNCGANQVIFQAGIFANHINKSYDLAPPTSLVPNLEIFEQAIKEATGERPGPVHINQQFAEPLVNRTEHLTPVAKNAQALDQTSFHDLLSQKRGLLVVGELAMGRVQQQILKLSHRHGWPIFADIGSNMRFLSDENIIHHYDLGLLNSRFLSDLGIEAVVKFGNRLVSKRFWQWVKSNPSVSFKSLSAVNALDPSGLFEHTKTSVEKFLENFTHSDDRERICPRLKERSLMLTCVVKDFLHKTADNEAYFANRLVQSLKQKTHLFISSSMPIRDLDQTSIPTNVEIEVFTNRGASGIDGIISTALGVAIADDKLTVLLIGDIAFLHDTNGLMLLGQQKILIVVINNQGGGIFHLLPIGKNPAVSPWFDTPHEVDLAYLCRAHGVLHHQAHDEKSFDQGMNQFFSSDKSLVLEVMIDRNKNVELHQELYRKVRDMKL